MKLLPTFRYLLVFGVLVLGIVLRTYRLEEPLADWHSWRQADTAAVARNFVQEDFNLLYPRSDSLWALNEYQLPNPNRYFINEFPLYNGVVALVYQLFGIDHVYGRAVSIAFASLGALALFGLVHRLLGFWQAFLSLLYYQLMPYNIFYSRVVMPDPTFAALSVIAMYFTVLFVESRQVRHAVLLIISFALATLVKPYAVFMGIPILYWLLVNKGFKLLKSPLFYLSALMALVPLMLWRYHAYLNPEGTFASTWLLNDGNIRFTGAHFRWLIFDRLNRLIFATGGFVLFVVGLAVSHLKKPASLFFVWASAVFLYFIIFAKGNVNHDYYQLPIVAPGVVLCVIGAGHLLGSAKSRLSLCLNSTILLSLFLLSLAFGWYEVRGFFNINNRAIVEAGQAVDRSLPADALVIAPYGGDPAFLYQTNRNGWPVGENIEQRIGEGATHYVTTSFDNEFSLLKSQYQTVEQTGTFAILDLTRPLSP